MRTTRFLLHESHQVTATFVAPRLRQRLLSSEIQEAVEYIKTERVRHSQALEQYNKIYKSKDSEQASTEADTESLEIKSEESSIPPPPEPTVPLTGNAFFATLPKPLADFFKRFPPPPFRTYATKPTTIDDPAANPFLPNKNPLNDKYHDPIYSLRRQSDLYKAAYRYGITHLLPPLQNDKKFYEEKYETKPPLRGATKFKLSIAERKAPARKAEMEEAIAKADEVIAKARGSRWRRKMEKKQKEPLPWF